MSAAVDHSSSKDPGAEVKTSPSSATSSEDKNTHFVYTNVSKEINSHNIFFNTTKQSPGFTSDTSPVSPTSGGLVPFTPRGDEVAAPIVNLVNIHESSKKYVVIG